MPRPFRALLLLAAVMAVAACRTASSSSAERRSSSGAAKSLCPGEKGSPAAGMQTSAAGSGAVVQPVLVAMTSSPRRSVSTGVGRIPVTP